MTSFFLYAVGNLVVRPDYARFGKTVDNKEFGLYEISSFYAR